MGRFAIPLATDAVPAYAVAAIKHLVRVPFSERQDMSSTIVDIRARQILDSRGNPTIEVDVESRRGINDLFSVLTERGLRVSSMRNKANRLEELFMRLVDSKDAPGQGGGS